jgi:flagellar hook protein FlgE
MGRVASRTLEASNVDLTSEFVNLIAAQRGFQANTRVITVGNEILLEMVNLIR